MSLLITDRRYSLPLYSIAEAARYLDVSDSTFRTWVRGYERHPSGKRSVSGAPIVTSLDPQGGKAVPFIGFAEGYVLASLKKAGVPLQRIRPALDYLQQRAPAASFRISAATCSSCITGLREHHAGQTDSVREKIIFRATRQQRSTGITRDHGWPQAEAWTRARE